MIKALFGRWFVPGQQREPVFVYRCPHGVVRATKNPKCKCHEKNKRR